MRNIGKEGIVCDYLSFQIKRLVILLAKRILEENESQKRQHDEMINKLKTAIPKEYHAVIDASNYFTNGRFSYLRKITLDNSNSIINELMGLVEKFDFVSLNGNFKY